MAETTGSIAGEKVLALPGAAAGGLLLLSLVGRVQGNEVLLASTLGAAAVL